MSQLRPTLNTGSDKFCPSNGTAYLMILNSIRGKKGLIHGKLHEGGQSCAIGSYFDVNSDKALPNSLIDEVAAVNDSMPRVSKRVRRLRVMRWLKWKLCMLGMKQP